jgi:hypothetical protein
VELLAFSMASPFRFTLSFVLSKFLQPLNYKFTVNLIMAAVFSYLAQHVSDKSRGMNGTEEKNMMKAISIPLSTGAAMYKTFV